MAAQPGEDWVEMKAEVWPSTISAPDGRYYQVNDEGRVWVRPYHVAAFVEHRLQPLLCAHPDVADAVADAIGNRHADIHERIAAAATTAAAAKKAAAGKNGKTSP